MKTYRPPAVVEGTLVDAAPTTLAELVPTGPSSPPATPEQLACLCGKGSIEAHGPYTCREVLAIAARVEFGQRHPLARLVARLSGKTPAGWPQ